MFRTDGGYSVGYDGHLSNRHRNREPGAAGVKARGRERARRHRRRLSWIPSEILESLGIERYAVWRFRQANGSVLERWTGAAFVFVAGKRAADDVAFGEPGDLVLLGARSLEGLNLRVEPALKRLVDADPAPTAASH